MKYVGGKQAQAEGDFGFCFSSTRTSVLQLLRAGLAADGIAKQTIVWQMRSAAGSPSGRAK
jgi:hypothetical protein